MKISNNRCNNYKDFLAENSCFTLHYDDSFKIVESPYHQRAGIEHNERIGINCVQAFINNVSFPSSLEELLNLNNELPGVDDLLQSEWCEWTVPKWAKLGDIVFFMHSKTAISTITRLRTELKTEENFYSPYEYQTMMELINNGLKTYSVYGGKIFAIGRVAGAPESDDAYNDEPHHWSSRIYAKIDNIVHLDKPVDISEFNSFIYVSRGSAITPVWGNEFDSLKEVIAKKNTLPWYVVESLSAPVPLRKINKFNWISVANDYRRSFILESQFRSFYVNYLLYSIGDRRTFYSECRCIKPGINPSFIDNVFYFYEKYLPVEVKLSVSAEPNIKGQVNKYCYNSVIYLNNEGKTITSDNTHEGKVLVIDTDYLYMYDATSDSINRIFDLDKLCSQKDLNQVKKSIVQAL